MLSIMESWVRALACPLILCGEVVIKWFLLFFAPYIVIQAGHLQMTKNKLCFLYSLALGHILVQEVNKLL